MNTIFEISKVVLPAIIAGLFTFLITKYTYNNNRPLDKIEIAYNRIYYPLYRIISDENINEDINKVINKSKIYFTKYEKYIDISTKRLFKALCKCDKKTEQKSNYKRFKDNIYDRNSYLRTRLGYLQPSFYQLYKYAMPNNMKALFRIFIGVIVAYFSLISCSITINRFNIIFNICSLIFFISLLWIVYELILCFLRFLYYKIRK